MFDRLSGSSVYDFAAPTSWSTVAYGKRGRTVNQSLFVFTAPAKAIAPEQKAASGRGRQPRKFKGPTVITKGMTARAIRKLKGPPGMARAVRTRARAQRPELPRELVSVAVAAAANLAKLVEADKENYVCCVCMDRPVQVRFNPCNHSALCRSCTLRLGQHSLHARRCPLCRATVKQVVDLASGKRVKDSEPFGTFKKAGEDVLASRRLISARTRRAASTRQQAQEEAGNRDGQPAAFSWAVAGWEEIAVLD